MELGDAIVAKAEPDRVQRAARGNRPLRGYVGYAGRTIPGRRTTAPTRSAPEQEPRLGAEEVLPLPPRHLAPDHRRRDRRRPAAGGCRCGGAAARCGAESVGRHSRVGRPPPLARLRVDPVRTADDGAGQFDAHVTGGRDPGHHPRAGVARRPHQPLPQLSRRRRLEAREGTAGVSANDVVRATSMAMLGAAVLPPLRAGRTPPPFGQPWSRRIGNASIQAKWFACWTTGSARLAGRWMFGDADSRAAVEDRSATRAARQPGVRRAPLQVG